MRTQGSNNGSAYGRKLRKILTEDEKRAWRLSLRFARDGVFQGQEKYCRGAGAEEKRDIPLLILK